MGKIKGRKYNPKAVKRYLISWEPNSYNYYIYLGHCKVIRTLYVIFQKDYTDKGDNIKIPGNLKDIYSKCTFPPKVNKIHGKKKASKAPKDKFNNQTATNNNGHITGPTNVITMETISFSYKNPSEVFINAVPCISYSISHLELIPRGVSGLKILPRVFYTTWTANKITINKSLIKPANIMLT